jgi:plasmid stabilization system protein ParE
MSQLKLRPEAEAELVEAFAWYEDQRKGLGLDLLLSVEATLEKIRRHPETFPVVRQQVRRALLKRFPYGIFYVKEGAQISVIAIFHARRNPRIWQRRANT